jgi:hypothetical protein
MKPVAMIQELSPDVNLNPEATREIFRLEDAYGCGKHSDLHLSRN